MWQNVAGQHLLLKWGPKIFAQGFFAQDEIFLIKENPGMRFGDERLITSAQG